MITDSIPDFFESDCPSQRALNPSVCCVEEIEGVEEFCPLQCVLPAPNSCICIDPFSGERIRDSFPQPNLEDPNAIDCINVFPPTVAPGMECVVSYLSVCSSCRCIYIYIYIMCLLTTDFLDG